MIMTHSKRRLNTPTKSSKGIRWLTFLNDSGGHLSSQVVAILLEPSVHLGKWDSVTMRSILDLRVSRLLPDTRRMFIGIPRLIQRPTADINFILTIYINYKVMGKVTK